MFTKQRKFCVNHLAKLTLFEELVKKEGCGRDKDKELSHMQNPEHIPLQKFTEFLLGPLL